MHAPGRRGRPSSSSSSSLAKTTYTKAATCSATPVLVRNLKSEEKHDQVEWRLKQEKYSKITNRGAADELHIHSLDVVPTHTYSPSASPFLHTQCHSCGPSRAPASIDSSGDNYIPSVSKTMIRIII